MYTLLIIVLALLVIVVIFNLYNLTVALIFPAGLVVWTFVGTRYVIEGNTFKYRCGLLSGEFQIDSIREIIKGETVWIGANKAATATRGLLIKYNKFDDVYVSPQDNDEMVEVLLSKNTAIKVSTAHDQ